LTAIKNGLTNIDKDLIRLIEETVIEIDWINEGLNWIGCWTVMDL